MSDLYAAMSDEELLTYARQGAFQRKQVIKHAGDRLQALEKRSDYATKAG